MMVRRFHGVNNYLYAELRKNSFYIESSGIILGKSFSNIKFKIDTGCTYSTIPLSRLYLYKDLSYLKELKSNDIRNNVVSAISYGVESGGVPHSIPETFEDKMACPALKFQHRLTNFSLGGYSLPDTDIFINYDRCGNILIGMDILSKFDIHIGKSNKTNNIVLLAVLKEQSNKSDYESALLEHFGLVNDSSLLAENFRNTFRK